MFNPHIFQTAGGIESINLRSVGLVFKLKHAFLKGRRTAGDEIAFDIMLSDYLDLVTLRNIADIMSLEGENKFFT
jgi:single-stranded DNA-specific DHH superfamily exonuclease